MKNGTCQSGGRDPIYIRAEQRLMDREITVASKTTDRISVSGVWTWKEKKEKREMRERVRENCGEGNIGLGSSRVEGEQSRAEARLSGAELRR